RHLPATRHAGGYPAGPVPDPRPGRVRTPLPRGGRHGCRPGGSAVRPAPGGRGGDCRVRRAGRRLRPVLRLLLDLPRKARPVPGGPVRAPGLPRPGHRPPADDPSGRAGGGTRLRPLRMVGAGLERARWANGRCSASTARPCRRWPRRPARPAERSRTANAPANKLGTPKRRARMTRISPNKLRRHLQRLQESLPVALVKRFVEADLMTQAASLSFYTLLSLAPLLVLLLWLTASLYPPAQQSLVDQIGALAGEQAAVVAETIIRNADSQPDVGSLAGLASTGLLFVGATVVFAQLQGALNLIFRTGGEKLGGLGAWLRKRVFSLGVVLALGFLLIVSMI